MMAGDHPRHDCAWKGGTQPDLRSMRRLRTGKFVAGKILVTQMD